MVYEDTGVWYCQLCQKPISDDRVKAEHHEKECFEGVDVE